MYFKTRAIVLKNTNYSESSIISKIYTREFGVKTYMLRGIRKGKSKIRTSMIQPLSLIDLDVYQKPNTSINSVKDLRNSPILFEIQDNILKKTVAIFMTEIINHCLTEEINDEELFDFLENQIIVLEQQPISVLFPCIFLIKLTEFLGVFPQGKYDNDTPYFSIEDGIFVGESSTYTASKSTSQMISNIISGENLGSNSNGNTRRDALAYIVKYYQFHIIRNKKVKSIDILSEILN